jgi:TIR domain
VCACNLRDFIDRASRNAKIHYCRVYHPRRFKRSLADVNINSGPEQHYDVFRRSSSSIFELYETSYKNIIRSFTTSLFHDVNKRSKGNSLPISDLFSPEECENLNSEEWEENGMNFEFILLDYTENDYKCYKNYKMHDGMRRYNFNEIDPCNHYQTTTYPYEGGSGDESNEEVTPPNRPHETTTRANYRNFELPFDANFFYAFLTIPLIILIVMYCKKKRADIKYFFSIFKNSLILSLDKEDKKSLMLNRKKSNAVDNFTYDVFVSYSEKDRGWVLDQLIPNIERRSEINICLHERDFQVGLSILENIIQCMDKSRCLLLVVSESFLKSNWCSFEMHLAQHR